MRVIDLLVIGSLALFFFGLVPLAGSWFASRKKAALQKRFARLLQSPALDYKTMKTALPGSYHFNGFFESEVEGKTLWVAGADLTMRVSLANATVYMLADNELIKGEKITAFNDSSRVFVGGTLAKNDGRPHWESGKAVPLLVIFYEGNDETLGERFLRAAAAFSPYNSLATPFSWAAGAITLILTMLYFLRRPILQISAYIALFSAFIPLYPSFPPGVLFTVFNQNLASRAQKLRARRDIAALLGTTTPSCASQRRLTLFAGLLETARAALVLTSLVVNTVFYGAIIWTFVLS
jgi:hypothetical protein